MQFFTPLTISITALCGFLFGSIWYSPILFMNAWLIGEGITRDHIKKRSKLYLLQINMYSFVAHGAMASVLALILDLLQVTSLKVALSLAALLVLGFIVTVKFIEMLYTVEGVHYNRKAQIRFLVNSGYYICMVEIMTFILFSLT